MNRRSALAAVSAAVVSPRLASAQQPVPKLRVGFGYADAMAEGVYADKLGLFKSAGLDVTTIGFPTGGALTNGLLGGAIDVAVSNVVNVAVGISHGAPMKLVAGGALYLSSNPTQALVVAEQSPIKTAKDLEGKTLAVTALKDLTEVGCRAWIDSHGADSKQVKIVEIGMAAMGPAVGRGTVDAAFVGEPYVTIAKTQGLRPLGYCYDAIAPQFYLSAWFATDAFVRANPALVKRFAAVIYDAARWANDHRDQSAPMLADVAKLDLSLVTKSTRMRFGTVLDPKLIQPALTAMQRYDAVDKLLPADQLIAKLG